MQQYIVVYLKGINELLQGHIFVSMDIPAIPQCVLSSIAERRYSDYPHEESQVGTLL